MTKSIIVITLMFIFHTSSYCQSLSQEESKAVFEILFGNEATQGMTLTKEDCNKAEQLLTELIEKSCQMSIMNGLASGTTGFRPTLVKIARNIVREVASDCGKALKEGAYYESVRATLARNWRSAFELRKMTKTWI